MGGDEMTDIELLDKVKKGLNISGNYNDDTLLVKVLAVKQYMLNLGIPSEQIETDLGVAALTVGVNDLWNISSGDVSFSRAFELLIAHLQIVSLPEVVIDV
jgi:hypothetical protein